MTSKISGQDERGGGSDYQSSLRSGKVVDEFIAAEPRPHSHHAIVDHEDSGNDKKERRAENVVPVCVRYSFPHANQNEERPHHEHVRLWYELNHVPSIDVKVQISRMLTLELEVLYSL
jgi:hypothetical protein